MAIEAAEKLLLSAAEASALCRVGRSLWWSMHSAGKVPLPVRLGRRTLWRAEELREWTRAGCPSRDRWLAAQGAER